MKVIQESRLYDSVMKLTLGKITLTDTTMIANRTLLYQEQSMNKGIKSKALYVVSESRMEESPKFKGLLSLQHIELTDMRVNFNPSTFNMMLKLFAAKKPNTKPVNDAL